MEELKGINITDLVCQSCLRCIGTFPWVYEEARVWHEVCRPRKGPTGGVAKPSGDGTASQST